MGVHHFKNVELPEVEFEFHTNSLKLYSIDLTVQPPQGYLIAENVTEYETARSLVKAWISGYRTGLKKGHLPVVGKPYFGFGSQ